MALPWMKIAVHILHHKGWEPDTSQLPTRLSLQTNIQTSPSSAQLSLVPFLLSLSGLLLGGKLLVRANVNSSCPGPDLAVDTPKVTACRNASMENVVSNVYCCLTLTVWQNWAPIRWIVFIFLKDENLWCILKINHSQRTLTHSKCISNCFLHNCYLWIKENLDRDWHHKYK